MKQHTFYEKRGKKYVPVSVLPFGAMQEGIWIVEKDRKTNLDWILRRVTEIGDPVDLVPLATLLTLRDELGTHLYNCIEKWNRDKEGVSASMLANESLAWISQHLTERVKIREQVLQEMFPNASLDTIKKIIKDKFLLTAILDSKLASEKFNV